MQSKRLNILNKYYFVRRLDEPTSQKIGGGIGPKSGPNIQNSQFVPGTYPMHRKYQISLLCV